MQVCEANLQAYIDQHPDAKEESAVQKESGTNQEETNTHPPPGAKMIYKHSQQVWLLSRNLLGFSCHGTS